MTVDSTLDFNAVSEGATVPTTGSWTTNGTAPVALVAATLHGTRGARWASTSSAGRIQYDYGSIQTARAVANTFYFNIRTMSTAAMYLGSILSATTSAVVQADWRVNTNMTVTLRNNTTPSGTPSLIAVQVSSATLSANTWYRCEWKVSQVTGAQELRIYVGENTAPLMTLTGTYSGNATRVAAVGPYTVAAGGAIDVDTLRTATDFTGAFSGGGGGPTPPTPVTQSFDSQTLNSPISLSAPWATSGSIPTATAASALHGAAGVAYTAGTAGRIQHDLGSPQASYPVYTSSYFRIITMPTSAALYLGAILDLPTGGTLQADWRVNNNGTVTLRNDPGTGLVGIGTSANVLATNTWYRSEWMVDDFANTQQLRIYALESTVPLFTLSGAFTPSGTLRVLSFGPNVAYAGGSVQMDTLRVDDDWPGPFGTPTGGTPPAAVLMTFDSSTPSAPITMSAPWSISGTAPTALGSSSMHGAVGVYWDDLTAGRRIQYDYGSNITTVPIMASGYFRVKAWPTSANLCLCMITSLASGGTVQADIRIDAGTHTMSMRNGGSVVATSPTSQPISIDTYYRFSWTVDDTANTQELRVFFDDFSETKFTLTGAYSGTLTRVVGFGSYLAAAGGELEMDTLRLDSSWPGPYAPVDHVDFYCSSPGVMTPTEDYRTY